MGKHSNALLLAVIPGLGHLYLGRCGRGLLVFAVFAAAVNGLFLADAMGGAEALATLTTICIVAVVAMVLYSVLHVVYVSRRFERRPVTERKDYHFRRGLSQYLAGAFDAAEAEFRTVLRLDSTDIDARFHLAMSQRALGEHRKAIKTFRRCLSGDVDRKWKWEITEQLEQLKRSR